MPKRTHRLSVTRAIIFISIGAVVGAMTAGVFGPILGDYHPVLQFLFSNVAFGIAVAFSINAALKYDERVTLYKAGLCFALGGVFAFLLEEAGGGLPGLVEPMALGLLGGLGLAWATAFTQKQALFVVIGAILAHPVMFFLMPDVEFHLRGPRFAIQDIDYYGSVLLKTFAPFLTYIAYGIIVGLMYFLGQPKNTESHVKKNFGI